MTIPIHHFSTHDGARGGAKPLILIVDDSNVVRSIVRAIFQTENLIHVLTPGGQHNHWHIRKLANLLADLKATDLRKHDIQ